MDKFIVSARKYRPQNFDSVVGQQHITTTLKNAIKNNQLAHAFLFTGPRGVGKTTCARILAKTINCEDLQPDGEACNHCNSCRSFNEGTSLNIHELDAASNNSVDDIRALVEQVRFAPQAGKYKVYIVDEVHMLSASAFNAFLKTLEEPPPYAIFILATTEKYKILPTILSRCQIFDFKRITTNDTVAHLQGIATKEHITAEKAALQVIAQKSEGCLRDALSILDKIVSFTDGDVTYKNTLEHLNILDHDYYFRLLENLLQQDLAAAMLLYDEINRKGFEGDLLLNGFAEFIRNLLVCKDKKAAALLDVVEGMQKKYFETANATDTSFLISALNILNDAEINYKMARNKRLHVELAIIKLNFLQQALEITAEGDAVVKKKRIDAPVAYKIKNIKPLQQKAVEKPAEKQSERLIIEEYAEVKNFAEEPDVILQTFLESNVVAPVASKTDKPVAAVKPTTANASKKNLLQGLKEKYGDKYIITEIKEPEPLEKNKLFEAWFAYALKIEQQQKHTAANTLKTARLIIESDTKFYVAVNSSTQQKFIDQERTMLCDHIQKTFNNRAISFQIKIEEGAPEKIPAHLLMNSRQRYERIAEQYPMLRELKEKLKLEIDY